LNLLPLVLYGAAGVAYAIHFARRQPPVGRTATVLLLLGALTHTFVIGMEAVEFRHMPVANRSLAISTFVWLLALAYLYVEVTTEERAMGVFILPIAIGLQTIPVLSPGVERPVPDSPLFWIHVASLLFAYASFALGGVLALIYVLQFKEIKKKHLGYFYTRLPSLQILDVMNSRAVTIGWLFLTVGLGVGVIWTAQARGITPDDPNLQAMALDDPKVFLALVTWAIYSFALLARRTMGWSGRKAAWLSALGFVIVLLNFVPLNYLVTTSHTFQ
jgi:ABC-type transport system involved in cytochrome c biogenesis permease subunit